MTEKIQKTNQITNYLKNLGVNKNGYNFKTTSIIFKTMIQSKLEYGLPVFEINDKWMKELNNTFIGALKTTLNSKKNSSNLANLIIGNQLPFDLRILELKGRYLYSLKKLNNSNPNLIISKLFREELNVNDNTLYNTIVQNQDIDISFKKSIETVKTNWMKSLLAQNPYNVAGSLSNVNNTQTIFNYKNITYPPILKVQINRQMKNLIKRWLVGEVVYHQLCFNCNRKSTRIHVVECSGVKELISEKYNDVTFHDHPKTNLIYLAFNRFRNVVNLLKGFALFFIFFSCNKL